MNELRDVVIKAKKGDGDNMIHIIDKFTPLVKKYGRKLSYDGAESDLIIALIEVIKSLPISKSEKFKEDKYIVGYINTSVKRKYIQLMKKSMNILNSETELSLDIYCSNIYDYENSESFYSDCIFLKNLLEKLTAYQREIIHGIFFQDYSEEQLSKSFNVSRQAINKTKNKALKNLKELAME